MSDANTTALAALLRSHPEECAAVLCTLVVSADEPASVQNVMFYIRHQTDVMPVHDVIAPILLAMGETGIVTVSSHEWGPGSWFVLVAADRYSIARMGAAAWLRARVGPPSSTNPFNLGAIRLCALASEALAIGAAHVAMVAVEMPFPRDAFEYRLRLTVVEQVSEGLPVAVLDVDAEVAAVWGRGTGRGAGAPAKGEQR